jgi:hypothetical protein
MTTKRENDIYIYIYIYILSQKENRKKNIYVVIELLKLRAT